uniref:Ankyrin-like protein n=1 Tax=Parastrongyloides trichosuri TaxID=131310 RepID=A0A0N4ZSG1_PARTI
MGSIIEKDCDKFVSTLMSTKCVILDDIRKKNALSLCYEIIDDFIPPAYLVVAMKFIFNLISEKGCVFTLARHTAECTVDDIDDCLTRPQYMYWISWIIKRIVKDHLVSYWEIIELYKISLALKLNNCIVEIKKNFIEEICEYEELINNNPVPVNDDTSVMYYFKPKPWGSS